MKDFYFTTLPAQADKAEIAVQLQELTSADRVGIRPRVVHESWNPGMPHVATDHQLFLVPALAGAYLARWIRPPTECANARILVQHISILTLVCE